MPRSAVGSGTIDEWTGKVNVRKRCGRFALRVTGWSLGDGPPDDPRYVLIAAPHTSNWDFPYMIFMAWAFEMRIRWIGKDALFRGPMGWVMHKMGGISVRRGERSGSVHDLATRFKESDELIVVVPAEGTRGVTDHWKSGFYRIADAADVPIVCSCLDWGTRTGWIGPPLVPSGDLVADMDVIREFYAGSTGKHPEKMGTIVLREEFAEGSRESN